MARIELQPWAMLPKGPAWHEVRPERVLEHGGHRARRADVARGDRVARQRGADDDAAEARLEVLGALREGDDGHDLARRGDVEAVLPRHPVGLAPEAEDHAPQGAIVHVERAAPGHEARIDLALVAEARVEVTSVVHHRRQQVVGGGDGVDVAREVQVDVVGGDERRAAAAGAAALDPEHRPERGLAQAEPAEAHREADGGRGLALAGGGRVHGGDEDEAAFAAERAAARDGGEVELRLASAVGFDELIGDAELAGHVEDRLR